MRSAKPECFGHVVKKDIGGIHFEILTVILLLLDEGSKW